VTRLPILGRLGITELAVDHFRTFRVLTPAGSSRRSPLDWIVFVGLPVIAGAASGAAGVELRSSDALLAGTAIITGLLFGLLIHVLSLGATVRADARFPRDSRMAILVDELRANVAWACAVGLLLSGGLALVGAFTVRPEGGVDQWVTGAVIAGGTHLALTLLMILKRIRSTYEQL